MANKASCCGFFPRKTFVQGVLLLLGYSKKCLQHTAIARIFESIGKLQHNGCKITITSVSAELSHHPMQVIRPFHISQKCSNWLLCFLTHHRAPPLSVTGLFRLHWSNLTARVTLVMRRNTERELGNYEMNWYTHIDTLLCITTTDGKLYKEMILYYQFS